MSALDTKFCDMLESQRAAWLDWANSHDWGVRARFLSGGAFLGCVDHAPDEAAPLFSTPRDLRNWAGY